MSSFRKLQLVSEEEINRLKQKQLSQYDPQLRAAAFLQSEIDDILTNKDMDAQRKTTLFQTAQQRFASLLGKSFMATQPLGGVRTRMEHDEEAAAPAAAAPAAPAVVAAPQQLVQAAQDVDEEDDIQIEQILGTVPNSQKERAQKLLNFLESKKADISSDNTGQLVIQGEPVEGTNYQDLILSLYTSKKAFYPQGLDVFVKALRKLNVPRGIIKNHQLFAPNPFSISSSKADTEPIDLFFDASSHSPVRKKATPHPPGTTPNVKYVYGSSKVSSKSSSKRPSKR